VKPKKKYFTEKLRKLNFLIKSDPKIGKISRKYFSLKKKIFSQGPTQTD